MSAKRKLIEEIDKQLSLLRKSWLEAKDVDESKRWWEMINKALDERLAAMAL